MTMSGALSATKEWMPRMFMYVPSPGMPLFSMTWRPESWSRVAAATESFWLKSLVWMPLTVTGRSSRESVP